ncbi:hypothetical protein [Mucilaginibacter aquatilis]|uniref:Uncharacterized protein n=1 Tax=Mucilaginibacter aquatilis TaxID=1517760 RepID=A0A6I4I394_9SPHI|nr:hypothetical protein [Mucilaginibacter aquatilis]MVN89605.1 hypothetical protein [Mucilaginibacter aquatilis]
MIQKYFKTITGELSISIPEKLDEISLGQLMALQSASKLSDLDAIQILSGVPLENLKQVQDFNDFEEFNETVATLALQISSLYNSNQIPDDVTFNIDNKLKKVKVFKNLSIEPAGAFMAARDIIVEEMTRHAASNNDEDWQQSFTPSLKACSLILANYFYCRATQLPYDEELAEQFATEIEKQPITTILPIAKYFFLSYPNLSKPKTGFWHRLRRLWNRGLALKILKSSGTSTQLMHWPEAI